MISVVVPTRNSDRTLSACANSIVQQVDVVVELIIVDNHSTDSTQAIASVVGARLIVAGPERATQRNVGLAYASGDVVVFIDSDMVLEPDVLREVQTAFRDGTSLQAVFITERSYGTNYWARVKAFERVLISGDEQIEAARAFRREQLLGAGGWDQALLGPEDWELTDRYRRMGAAFSHTESFIWHDEGAPTLSSLYRKKAYYGYALASYANQDTGRMKNLPMRYLTRTRIRQMAHHPFLAFGLVVAKTTEFIGAKVGARRVRDELLDVVYKST